MSTQPVARQKAERPVNLDLTQFSFPFAALASITHRISGVILFVAIAFLLSWFCLLYTSDAADE